MIRMIEAVAANRSVEPSEDSPNQLTVEQLAAKSGMSVRNIRAHQARGLLSPPEVRMRVGYYGPEHIAQLQLIRDLQEEGFNLGGIKRLLEDTHGTAERLLRVRQSLAAPPQDRPAETHTAVDLGRRFDAAVGKDEGMGEGHGAGSAVVGAARCRSTQAATDSATSSAPADRSSSGSPRTDSMPIARAPTATAICMSVGASPTYADVSGR